MIQQSLRAAAWSPYEMGQLFAGDYFSYIKDVDWSVLEAIEGFVYYASDLQANGMDDSDFAEKAEEFVNNESPGLAATFDEDEWYDFWEGSLFEAQEEFYDQGRYLFGHL